MIFIFSIKGGNRCVPFPIMKLVSLVVSMSLLSMIAGPPCHAGSEVYGEVIPVGVITEMVDMKSWRQIAQAMPVISGDTHIYKTGDGKLSLLLTDGTRIEADKNTEFSVTGKTSKNPLELKRGVITFSVPGGVDINIAREGIRILVPADAPEWDKRVIGTVSYDGKTAFIGSEQGEIKVSTPADGMGEMIILSGESYSYTFKDDDSLATVSLPVQEKVLSARNAALVGAGLAVVLGLGLAFGGGGGSGSGGGGSNPPASPSSP